MLLSKKGIQALFGLSLIVTKGSGKVELSRRMFLLLWDSLIVRKLICRTKITHTELEQIGSIIAGTNKVVNIIVD